jgi:hypothetical protein
MIIGLQKIFPGEFSPVEKYFTIIGYEIPCYRHALRIPSKCDPASG